VKEHPAILSAEDGEGRCVVVPASGDNIADSALGRCIRWLGQRSKRTSRLRLALNGCWPSAPAAQDALTAEEALALLDCEDAAKRRRGEAALIALGPSAIERILCRGNAASRPPPEPPSLEALIEQLGSPRYAEREAASGAFAARGVRAKTILEKNRNHEDAEIAERCRRILESLTREARDDADVRQWVEQRTLRSIVRVLHRLKNALGNRYVGRLRRTARCLMIRSLAAASLSAGAAAEGDR